MNQPAIVDRLRQWGCSVQDLSKCGGGVPDLLIGFRGNNYLVEVKNKTGRGVKLTERQANWHRAWQGQKIIISDLDEVDRWLGTLTYKLNQCAS